MTATTHPVTPEEVMAFLDGELSHVEAQAVSAHLEDCAECAGVVEQFRNLSQSLSEWEVPAVSSKLDEPVRDAAVSNSTPVRTIRFGIWNWRLWAIGGGGAFAAILVFALIIFSYSSPLPRTAQFLAQKKEIEQNNAATNNKPEVMNGLIDKQQIAALPLESRQMDSLARISPGVVSEAKTRDARDRTVAPPPSAPMIARTVSLTIQVKDFAAARAALDNILARHHGYSAQLSVNTQENAPRDLYASLRIPAPELLAAIGELKTLGRVQNESQTGEEVTQQHADKAARLKNSRETEERLQAILQQRTGKIEDVLEVEEEIARVRGEIESMESDQDALEHRVSFATVNLQLTEEYKAQLNSPDASATTRMHNSFVAGFHNASETVLRIVLFLEEYGPPILIWLVILGLPASFAWRRYKRMHSRF